MAVLGTTNSQIRHLTIEKGGRRIAHDTMARINIENNPDAITKNK
jgi:hypothetical protein